MGATGVVQHLLETSRNTCFEKKKARKKEKRREKKKMKRRKGGPLFTGESHSCCVFMTRNSYSASFSASSASSPASSSANSLRNRLLTISSTKFFFPNVSFHQRWGPLGWINYLGFSGRPPEPAERSRNLPLGKQVKIDPRRYFL